MNPVTLRSCFMWRKPLLTSQGHCDGKPSLSGPYTCCLRGPGCVPPNESRTPVLSSLFYQRTGTSPTMLSLGLLVLVLSSMDTNRPEMTFGQRIVGLNSGGFKILKTQHLFHNLTFIYSCSFIPCSLNVFFHLYLFIFL